MRKAVVIDTNIAVLLAVGLVDLDIIGRHKRLQKYDEIDFKNLLGLISQYSELVFLPNILTETSNLIRYLNEPDRTRVASKLRDLIDTHRELTVASAIAAGRSDYLRLGLADTALLCLAAEKFTVVTDDAALHLAAQSAGYATINFTHIQAQRPDFP